MSKPNSVLPTKPDQIPDALEAARPVDAKLLTIKSVDGLHNIITVTAANRKIDFTFDLSFFQEGKLYFGTSQTSDEEDIKLLRWCTISADQLSGVTNGKLTSDDPDFNAVLTELNEIAFLLRARINLAKHGYVKCSAK